MRIRLIMFLCLAAIVVLAAATQPALAQCAMCKQTVAGSSDAETVSRGLNLAVLVLLVPPVAIFGAIFGVVYRYRNVQDERQYPDREEGVFRAANDDE